METGEMGLVELFGYDRELNLIPPPVTSDNWGWLDDECEDMTEEEYCYYRDQVLKSDGFDVDRIPGVACFHQIQPYNVDKKTWDYEGYSRLAIEEYNFRFKDGDAGLEFVKVLKAMGQTANAMRFYLTLEARDLADGGKTKIYQAVVLSGVTEDTVSSFRLKPPEDEKGCSHGKEWFWEDHLCSGLIC
ncbi:hypothetical protein I3842_09G137500 [Carya illinoinensis]|uniref:Uncharacterized protein n=1 Tax=Carya illinoinensis TaxID=32201 RepID=A0A922E6S7_CARIL|nr:hypothetical protein I3842_09G137500 [Carya illinoinensis]KAG6696229.1 hypothetical protein I3842_09G137500 [Carya illinoinensis]